MKGWLPGSWWSDVNIGNKAAEDEGRAVEGNFPSGHQW